MTRKIVLYGWYGAGNIGDELLLGRLIEWAKNNDLDPVVISYDVEHTARIHNTAAIDVEDILAVTSAIRKSVACILGGGGIFQTHTNFTKSGLYRLDCGDVSAFARPALLARTLGIPSILLGQGVGPLNHEDAREIVKAIFEKSDLATVRDINSITLLREIGVTKPITWAPDLAWSLDIEKFRINNPPSHHNKRIALIIREWHASPGYEDRLIDAIKTTLNPAECTLAWIPFQNHSIVNRSASDKAFIARCMSKFSEEWKQEFIDEGTPEECIRHISACDKIVAMRMHAQMIAFKLGKTTLCIEYDTKMSELSKQVMQPAELRVSPQDEPEVWTKALTTLIDSKTEPTPVKINVKKLYEASNRHFELLDELLFKNQQNGNSPTHQHSIDDWPKWIIDKILEEYESQIQHKTTITPQLSTEMAKKETDLEISIQKASQYNDATLTQECEAKQNDIQAQTPNPLKDDYENQISILMHELSSREEKIKSLVDNIIEIKKSTSWKITAPLRAAKIISMNPRFAIYRAMRALFWKMPPPIQQALHGPRHAFVRAVRRIPVSPSFSSAQHDRATDLSWNEFNERILSNRELYRGIFIQELVIDWNVPLYQRPQHIATALGKIGFLVIYRTDNWAGDNVNGFREVGKNVWITNRYEVEQLQGVVRSVYSTAYAHTPDLILKNGRRGTIIYEYIDHIDPEISGDQENIRRLTELKNFAFSGGADYIVASAKKLYEEAVKEVGEAKVILIPNGVDTQHYRNPAHRNSKLPENLIEFRRKYKNIVGYFGALAPWLWYECINEIAKSRPDIGFVFIGPDYYGGASSLSALDNILYLGTVDYKVLPAYAHQFDVCFIPFKPGDIAKTTSPLKLFEYFALEKPVVVTSDMEECTAYTEVIHGNSVETLCCAIEVAIGLKDQPTFKARLRELADLNDWHNRALEYKKAFSSQLSLTQVQALIVDCHRFDNDDKRYYEEAYMQQESLYWGPVPSWIDSLGPIESVIDVGAAYGTLLTYTSLNKQCANVFAVDPVGYMSTSLKNRLNVNLIRKDFERESFLIDIKFDLVLFTEVIEHLNFHPLPTLLKLKELLKPDGKIIITTPDAHEWGRVTEYYSELASIPEYEGQSSEWIDGHIWQYSDGEIRDLFERAGFIVEKFEYSPGVSARHLCYLISVKKS